MNLPKKASNPLSLKRCFCLTFFLCAFVLNAQQIITATIVDENEIPIKGAEVVNPSNGTEKLSDERGKFSIKAKNQDVIEISKLGFQTQKLKAFTIKNKIKLKPSALDLGEFVITGYQKIKNRVFTGAASQVKMKDIKIEGVPDVSRLLEGRVAGLNIQNVTGTFGAAPRINIRGGASINSNVQPLWVIDGAVYEDIVNLSYDQLLSGDAVTLISSAVAGINPSDIEDIQVLKDASATSMYGARALNGVIVITTKRAKRNTPLQINIGYEQGLRSRPDYRKYSLLNSQETMAIYNEMHQKGYFGIEESLFGRRGGAFYLMYRELTSFNQEEHRFQLQNTSEQRAEFLRKYEHANTDWFKELFTLKPYHQLSVSFSGGGEKMANYASLSFYRDQGWSVADKVTRLTAHFRNTYHINEHFKTEVIIQGNLRKQKAPGTFKKRKNYNIGAFQRDFDINPFAYALSTPRTLRVKDENGNLEYYRNNWAPFNILNEYENNYMDINVLDLKIQAEVEYKINKALKANLTMIARHASTENEHFIKENSNVVLAYNADNNAIEQKENIYLYKPDRDKAVATTPLPEGGIFNKTQNALKSYLARVSLDYEKRWEQHDLKLFGFSELRYVDRNITPFNGYGIMYNRAYQVITQPLIFQKLLNDDETYFSRTLLRDRGITFSTNATYGYAGKYIINAVFNYEGANISGKGTQSRWLPTWNIGAKWNIDREEWFPKNKISTLALRSSYGFTAKMSEKAVNSVAAFTAGLTHRYHPNNREKELSLKFLENRDLTWEKMYEANIGFDIGFNNNQWNITADLYQRKSFDLIDVVRTSGIGGEYYKYANFADMETHGVELTLNTVLLNYKRFKWHLIATAGYYNQQITKLRNTPSTFDLVAGTGQGNMVGRPRGGLYSFQLKGIDTYGLPIFDFGDYPFHNFQFSESAGADFLDTQYAHSYLTYQGAIEPNFTGGISNKFSYKNLEFSFFVTYQFGNKIRLTPTYDPTFADINVFSSEYVNRWLNPGDESITQVPSIPSKDLIKLVGVENIERAYNTYNYAQTRVAEGSFVRMKNIALSYRFLPNFIKKWKLSSAMLSIQVTNPFLIYADSKLKGQDPEFFRTGGVSMPITRQYTLGVNVTF